MNIQQPADPVPGLHIIHLVEAQAPPLEPILEILQLRLRSTEVDEDIDVTLEAGRRVLGAAEHVESLDTELLPVEAGCDQFRHPQAPDP